MSVRFYQPRGIGYQPRTECQINGEHYGDVTSTGYWTCCGEPDEDATTCDGCGTTTSDDTTWLVDHGDHYCPNCWKEEVPC